MVLICIFYVHFRKGSDNADFVPAQYADRVFQKLVIEFLEAALPWN